MFNQSISSEKYFYSDIYQKIYARYGTLHVPLANYRYWDSSKTDCTLWALNLSFLNNQRFIHYSHVKYQVSSTLSIQEFSGNSSTFNHFEDSSNSNSFESRKWARTNDHLHVYHQLSQSHWVTFRNYFYFTEADVRKLNKFFQSF